jgi:hypothetical protein
MAAISYVPFLQAVFNTAPLDAVDWVVLTGVGVFLLAAEETRKWWHRRGGGSGRTSGPRPGPRPGRRTGRKASA